MSCNGDCANCGDPCGKGISLLERFKQDQNNKENSNTKTKEVVMSEAVGGCHAGNEEKIGRLDERSQFIVEKNNSCKWIGVIALIVAVLALFVAWTALRDLDALKDKFRTLDSEIKRIEVKADEAKSEATKGYNYVRKNKRSL